MSWIYSRQSAEARAVFDEQLRFTLLENRCGRPRPANSGRLVPRRDAPMACIAAHASSTRA
jgi:hypothetical protein